MSLAKAIAAEFQNEAAATRTMLERVPEDKLSWKPHEKSMSLGRVTAHIAEVTEWTSTIMDAEDWTMSGDYTPKVTESVSDLLETFDKNVAEFIEKISGYPDEDFMVTWSMKNGDEVVGAMPRVAAVRGFILSHHYHHRGQLSVYLRLLDVPLPMVYGPTADDMGAFGG